MPKKITFTNIAQDTLPIKLDPFQFEIAFDFLHPYFWHQEKYGILSSDWELMYISYPEATEQEIRDLLAPNIPSVLQPFLEALPRAEIMPYSADNEPFDPKENTCITYRLKYEDGIVTIEKSFKGFRCFDIDANLLNAFVQKPIGFKTDLILSDGKKVTAEILHFH